MPEDLAPSEAADAIMRTGWQLGDVAAFPLFPPVDWHAGDANRSWAFQLHAWDPLAPVLAAHSRDGDPSRLAFAAALALDWAAANPREGVGAGFAWYDMAVGLRAYRLAYVLDALARDETPKEGTQDPARHTVEPVGGPTTLKEMVSANHDYRGEW